MTGLVPAIHVFFRLDDRKTWMPGTRPGMMNTTDRFDAFDVTVVPFPYANRLGED
jgi:hypothetical protein